MVKFILSQSTNSINFQAVDDFNRSALHVAMLQGEYQIITILLKSGSDPTLKDIYEKTPYQVAKDKASRDVMRKFAGTKLQTWNWEKAKVPPITKEDEELQRQTKAEKNKRKKTRTKVKKKNKQKLKMKIRIVCSFKN